MRNSVTVALECDYCSANRLMYATTFGLYQQNNEGLGTLVAVQPKISRGKLSGTNIREAQGFVSFTES